MCGRLIRTSPVAVLRQLFDLIAVPDDVRDRYNLAPSEPVPVIRQPGRLELLRWGLEMPDRRHAGINVRVESLSRPLYRAKLRDQRCLVVVDGFYEWRSVGGKKYPYLIAREDRAPMVMAGLYDASDGCAVLTMPARGVVATLHDRMPVVLDRAAGDTWIDRRVSDVRPLLAAASRAGLIAYPVSARANSPRNDDASLLDRVAEPGGDVVPAETPRGKTLLLF
jgi:putative SOS response-associated peptidase YedK